MLYEAIIAFASLLLFFSSANENYRRLLHEMETIPKDIKDIAEQLKDESNMMNPPSKAVFDKLLADTESAIPNFDQDQFKLQSIRIENIKGIYEMKKKQHILGNVTERSILRQGINRPGNVIKKTPQQKATDRAFALMTQFVYAARYKLQYGQLLRKQYSYKVEYKIGYCFALMRDLRKKIMFLYTTMHVNFRAVMHERKPPKGYNVYSYSDLQSFLQLYETVVRLNMDLLDVVALTQRLIIYRMKALEAEKAERQKKRAAKKKAEEEKRKAEEEKKKAEEEQKKAEEERKKAEEEQKKAEEEQKKAEEEQKKAEEEKKKAEEEAKKAAG